MNKIESINTAINTKLKIYIFPIVTTVISTEKLWLFLLDCEFGVPPFFCFES